MVNEIDELERPHWAVIEALLRQTHFLSLPSYSIIVSKIGRTR